MAEGGRGWWGRARVLDESGGKVGAVWLSSPARLECGSAVSCVGRFKPIDDDEWGVSSRMQGLAGTVSVVHVTAVREAGGPLGAVLRMRQAVLASFSPDESDGAAVLAGSVCGDRAPIRSRGLDDAFATCGVSHLVAVSGGHLAILAGTLAALLGKTRLGPGLRRLSRPGCDCALHRLLRGTCVCRARRHHELCLVWRVPCGEKVPCPLLHMRSRTCHGTSRPLRLGTAGVSPLRCLRGGNLPLWELCESCT